MTRLRWGLAQEDVGGEETRVVFLQYTHVGIDTKRGRLGKRVSILRPVCEYQLLLVRLSHPKL